MVNFSVVYGINGTNYIKFVHNLDIKCSVAKNLTNIARMNEHSNVTTFHMLIS